MEHTLSVTELARNFSEYVNRVLYRRERFVLMRGNRPVAELRPVPEGRTLGDLQKILASLPHLTPEEANEFAEDLKAARTELAEQKIRDPWDS